VRYWLGPWVWRTPSGDDPYWGRPTGALSALDLRAIPHQAQAVAAAGDGLFITADATDLGGDYTNLGRANDPRDLTLGAVARATWRDRFGLARTPSGPDLVSIVYEHLTVLSDPTGDLRPPPIVPTKRRRFELRFGNTLLRSVRFRDDLEELVPVLDLLRRVYRATREANQRGETPANHHKKLLGYWMRKYGLDYRQFIPNDLPNEGVLDPDTIHTESFNKADSDTLGPDLSWTELSGDWDVVSNTARRGSSAGLARANADVSGTDHYVQISVVARSSNNGQGVVARKDSTSTVTLYYARIQGSGVGNSVELFKAVSGTLTELGSDSAVTVSLPDILKLECDGSTISTYWEGGLEHSLTDTAVTTGTRGGIRTAATTGTEILDSYEIADLDTGVVEDVSPVTVAASVAGPTLLLVPATSPVAATASVVGPTVVLSAAVDPTPATSSVPAVTDVRTEPVNPVVVSGSVIAPATALAHSAAPVTATFSVPLVQALTGQTTAPDPVSAAAGVASPLTLLDLATTPVAGVLTVVGPGQALILGPGPVGLALGVVAAATTLDQSAAPVAATFGVPEAQALSGSTTAPDPVTAAFSVPGPATNLAHAAFAVTAGSQPVTPTVVLAQAASPLAGSVSVPAPLTALALAIDPVGAILATVSPTPLLALLLNPATGTFTVPAVTTFFPDLVLPRRVNLTGRADNRKGLTGNVETIATGGFSSGFSPGFAVPRYGRSPILTGRRDNQPALTGVF
jgi:hypothetical protein